MRAVLAASVVLAACFLTTGPAQADGGLPPQPYHYLHPPPAFAGSNVTPFSGKRVLPVDYSRSTSWIAFTDDGQAGITADKGVFAVSPSTTAVVIQIKPVETPSGLPSQVAVDGNAYSITAVEQPGNGPARLARRVNVTLRWPHFPIAIYQFTGGSWRQLCYSDKAVFTPSTISCPTATLGTFAAVTSPSKTGVNTPSTPFAGLNPYIPILTAAALIVIAVIAGYLVTRPDRSGRPQSPDT